jgi:cysteine-rich repeat protein
MCTDCRYCKHLRAIGATAYLCLAECGDGHVANVQEDRDDNNTESGDGCDSTCLVECGYNCCAHDPSTCSAISTPCQYKDGSLVSQDLAPQAVVSLSSDNLSNMYPTAEASYMFTARESKTLKAAQVFQMPVTLTEQMIVEVSALEAASGEIQPTGDVRINSEDEFVVHGRCQHNAPAQIGWTFTPSITLEFYEALADDVVGSVACAAILFGAAAYLTKINYKTSSEYLAAKAKMMEDAQEKTEEREVAAGEVARKSDDNNHSGHVSEEVAGVQGVRTDTPAKKGMINT